VIAVNLKGFPRQQMNGHRSAGEGIQNNDVVQLVFGQLRHAQPCITQQNILLARLARRQVVKPFLGKSNRSRIDLVKIVSIGLPGVIGQGSGAQTDERDRKIRLLRHGPQQGFAYATVACVVSGGHMAK
jgi:hypothetical protein